jgi:hypothetical protein
MLELLHTWQPLMLLGLLRKRRPPRLRLRLLPLSQLTRLLPNIRCLAHSSPLRSGRQLLPGRRDSKTILPRRRRLLRPHPKRRTA